MKLMRLLTLTILFCAVLLWILPSEALADRVGAPYRGPSEMVKGTGTSAEDEAPASSEGTEGDTGDGGDSGDDTGENLAPPDVNPQSVNRGKVATTDGKVLWQWWWEHNKDRYLARLTAPGRVKSGSAYYWFGAGAKFPPREVVPASETQRKEAILKALRKVLAGRNPLEVKMEACIALGRLGDVPASGKEVKEKEPNNLVVRELISVIKRSQQAPELRQNAVLGLGITGDPDGCQFLFRNLTRWTAEDKPFVMIAFGLARYTPAIQLLLAELPESSRMGTATGVAAIHALGLYGPAAVEEMNAENREGIKALARLASTRGGTDEVIAAQAVAALGRLEQELGTVKKALRAKSPSIVRSAILALAYYSSVEKDAEAAVKSLTGVKNPEQGKVFAALALGDLASRLDPNSKVRAKILKFLREKSAERKSNYVRASAALALGLADDRTSVDAVAALLRDTTAVDYVLGAACLSLGLLRDTEHADLIRSALDSKLRGKADARGYAILGLALMGDTTRMSEVLKHVKGTPPQQTERQLTLAIGVLGGKDEVPTLVDYFAKDWIQKRSHAVSNAAFALCWDHDQSAVDKLVDLIEKSPDAKVRGMAVVALGYVGARDRVNTLARCYENMDHNNHFAHWSLLYTIAGIL